MSADPRDSRREFSPADAELAATAARWVVRREAGLKPEEQEELRAWLRADPRHKQAISEVDAHPSALNWPLHVGATERVVAGLEQRARHRRVRRRLASAGCAVLLLLAAGLFISRPSDPRPQGTIVVHAPRQQVLPDGSRVELNENAEIAVAFSAAERRVELLRGTAHFDVRKDPTRPFLVSTGNVTARAVGTAFAVSLEARQLTLLVTEGRVAVDLRRSTAALPPPPSSGGAHEPLALVQAGESVAVDCNAAPSDRFVVTALASAEWDSRLAWRVPRLEFASTSLRDAVAAMNRYNREQLVLADPSLGKLRISGVLRADQLDGLLEILGAEFRIVAARREGRILLQQAP